MMEVVNVDNLVSTKGEIFQGTRKWATFIVLYGCQIPLVIELLMQMVFMGCHKNIIH